MTDEERRERRGLRWDGTVTAGNVFTAVAMVIALLAWGFRLEGRVERTEERQKAFEMIASQYRMEDRQNEQLAFSELRNSLRRIEDYLMRGVTPPAAR